MWGFPKIRGTILGVPIIRIIVINVSPNFVAFRRLDPLGKGPIILCNHAMAARRLFAEATKGYRCPARPVLAVRYGLMIIRELGGLLGIYGEYLLCYRYESCGSV